jgi:hypothetical protein
MGTRTITVIMGSGEELTVDCAFCAPGFDPPRGQVKEYYFAHAPTKILLRRVSVEGDKVRYGPDSPTAPSWSPIGVEELFATEQECSVACAELNRQHEEDAQKEFLRRRVKSRRDKVGTVSYLRKEEDRLTRELERIRKMLKRTEP